MVSKILAGLMAVAVLSVGGYAYWQHGGCGACCETQAPAATAADIPAPADETPACCRQLSRTNCFSLPPGEGCCDDAAPTTEVLTVQPREVK